MIEVENNLERLRKLTHDLPAPIRLEDILSYLPNGKSEYLIEKGRCLVELLFRVPEISVMKAFMPKDSKLERHDHSEKEIIIVYVGEIEFQINGETKNCKVGNCVYFSPHQPHSAKVLQDTWMIGITIPESSDYPQPEQGSQNYGC